VVRCVLAQGVTCNLIWGASANSRSFWGGDDRALIGWAPEDSADGYAALVAGRVSDNPVQERCQGGAYAAAGYSRGD
jgi:uronate dehydrogenase